MNPSYYIRVRSVVELLVAKGYMELEETLMQWKQYPHLMEILEVRCHPACLVLLLFDFCLISIFVLSAALQQGQPSARPEESLNNARYGRMVYIIVI